MLRSVVAGRRRRPGPRARDDDRLRGGQGAARRPRRRRDRVLERRGRRAARAAAGDRASSASTTTARPAYPELVLSRHARDARGRAGARARGDPRRCSAATRRPRTTRRARSRRCSSAEPGLERAGARAPSSTPSRPPSRAGGGRFGELRPGRAACVGGVGRALRDPEGADRRDARLRHDARQAPADSLTSIGADASACRPESSWMYWAMSAAVRRSSRSRAATAMTGRGDDANVFHRGSFCLLYERSSYSSDSTTLVVLSLLRSAARPAPGPSRAIRERGTTRSKPAASARRLVSTSTCE